MHVDTEGGHFDLISSKPWTASVASSQDGGSLRSVCASRRRAARRLGRRGDRNACRRARHYRPRCAEGSNPSRSANTPDVESLSSLPIRPLKAGNAPRNYPDSKPHDVGKPELNTAGEVTKRRISTTGVRGGKPWSKGAIYKALANRVYLGEAVHKCVAYPGEHAAIIEQRAWTRRTP